MTLQSALTLESIRDTGLNLCVKEILSFSRIKPLKTAFKCLITFGTHLAPQAIQDLYHGAAYHLIIN